MQPILYPAVAEKQARLRFFITRDHKIDDMKRAVEDIRVVVNATPVEPKRL